MLGFALRGRAEGLHLDAAQRGPPTRPSTAPLPPGPAPRCRLRNTETAPCAPAAPVSARFPQRLPGSLPPPRPADQSELPAPASLAPQPMSAPATGHRPPGGGRRRGGGRVRSPGPREPGGLVEGQRGPERRPRTLIKPRGASLSRVRSWPLKKKGGGAALLVVFTSTLITPSPFLDPWGCR